MLPVPPPRRISLELRGNELDDGWSGTSSVSSIFTCTFSEERESVVEVLPASPKRLARMREKLVKYVPPHPRSRWPLAANILDPVRASGKCVCI